MPLSQFLASHVAGVPVRDAFQHMNHTRTGEIIVIRSIRKLIANTLTGTACLLSMAAPSIAVAAEAAASGAPAAAPKTAKELHQLLAKGSGWIQHKVEAGVSHGTGWILDAEKKLMVTNDHVVEGTDVVDVIFPVWKDGKLVREEVAYNSAPRVKGIVIDRDRNRDLALIKLDSIPEGTKAIELADAEPDTGDEVRLIGGFTNGGDGLVWGGVNGTVRTVGPQRSLKGAGMVREVLSNTQSNGGNSGSAVVNESGELVAVHSAFKNKANSVSVHISVVELKAYLKEVVPLADAKTASEFLARGKRRLASNRVDVAASDLSAALAIDETLHEAMYLRGKAFVAKGDARTALEDLNAALALDKGNYDYRVSRGLALRALGKNDEALADFSAAVRTHPDKTTAYNQRGITQLLAKQFAEAEEDFARAIATSENDAVLHANRANARMAQKKFDAAASDWAKAAKLAPWNPEYPNELGVTLLGMGKITQAVEAFIAAVDASNGHPLYLTNLGNAQRQGGDFKGAVKAYGEAIKGWGEKAPAALVALSYAGRGVANRELKLYREAIEDLSKAIDLSGGRVASHYLERALAHKAAGTDNAAADDLATAAKLDPKLAKVAELAAGPNLVGTWRGTLYINGVKVTQVIGFNADGTFGCTQTSSNQFGVLDQISDTGTWTLTKDNLTIRGKNTGTVVRKYKVNGNDFEVEVEEVGRTMIFSKVK